LIQSDTLYQFESKIFIRTFSRKIQSDTLYQFESKIFIRTFSRKIQSDTLYQFESLEEVSFALFLENHNFLLVV
jgi:hypothetical protein